MIKTKVNFTKSVLSSIEVPPKDSRRAIYRDAYQKGLVLMVTYGGTKTFYFSCRINRRKKLLKIGQFPYIDIDTAREKVFMLNKDIKNNINPLEVQQKTKVITLDDFFNNEYLPKYANVYKKESSCKENKRIFKRNFKEFKNRTMQSITRSEIDTLHKSVGQNSGIYLANRCLALIRHIFNIAIQFEFLNMNPASKIKMYPEKSRDRFLQPSEMTAFMNALKSSKNSQLKNLILLLLYTGQRKMNICSLKWSYIDFHNKILYLPETKNGDPHQIPLTDCAVNVLNDIKINQMGNQSEYVFATDKGQKGYITCPKKFWQSVLNKASISNLRIHDLRRTMGSYQAITGSSLQIIGKSLGHKSTQSTSVYARLNLDAVRDSMQKATNEMRKILNC